MTSKLSFLTSVAAGALALGMAAAPASAFDKVNWEWNLVANEWVSKTIDINVDVWPTGMVLLENMQVQVGDVKAVSIVDDVKNKQFGAPVVIKNNWKTVFTPPQYFAPDQLPEVVSAATAVGNNSSIESDVMVEVHEGQFLFDTAKEIGETGGLGAVAILGLLGAGIENTHHLMGAATLVGAVSGLVDKADVSAVSKVSNILNASVDSSATAVGNNKSINIEPRVWADSIMIGDVTQVSVADVTAISSVRDVDLYSYTSLGNLDRPIVNSVATAVGNNLSVSVKAPLGD